MIAIENTATPTMQTASFSRFKPWLICITASLFFFYEFVQLNMFNALDTGLMQSFSVNATELGKLSASYFIANIIFLLPAGMLLDRISARKLILTTMIICVGGTYMFALSTSLHMAEIARFLTGIGSAFCFLSVIRLASRWLPARRMALASGFIVTMGMLGGMVAQTPMTLLVNHIGWRHALMLNATVGLLFLILIAIIVRDYPTTSKLQMERQRADAVEIKKIGFWKTVKLAFINRQNWLCGVYTSLMNLPIFLLGAIWGAPYLTQVRNFSTTQASYVTTMIFLGTILGSPMIGWVSDRMGLRRKPMTIGALVTLVLVLMILYLPQLSLGSFMLLFLAVGFFSSTQVISYPTVAESNPHFLTATSVSIVSISSISGGAIFQPFFGWLMDLNWDGKINEGMRIYSTSNFHLALTILPIACLISLLAVIFIKETYCRVKEM